MTQPLITCDAALPLRGARVLVTGASGFIGHHFARQALDAGVEVFSLGRSIGPQGTIHCPADLCDAKAIKDQVRAVAPDLVFHIASPGVAFGTASFTEIVTALTAGGTALLSACAELPRVPHFLQTGSGLEYAPQDRPIRESDPIVPSGSTYGAAKAASSALLGGFVGLVPITLVRPFNVHGAGDRAPRLGNALVNKALEGTVFETSPGEQIRDFLHVDDFSNLLWSLAQDQPPKGHFSCLNAGSGDPRPLCAYICAIRDELHRHGVATDFRIGATPYRPGEPMTLVPDLSALHDATGWRPRIPFEEGIANFVRWRLSQCA